MVITNSLINQRARQISVYILILLPEFTFDMLIHVMISTTVAPILAAPPVAPTSQPAMTMMPLSMNMVLQIFVSHSFERCSLFFLDLDISQIY
jgi:hypothetical protein